MEHDSGPGPVAPATKPSTTLATGFTRTREAFDFLRRFVANVALRPMYALYSRQLRRDVLARPRPRHVAVIMDGNRRWAIREGLRPGAGHRRGGEKALELLDWCAALGIPEVTLWALSLENLDRSADEVGAIADVASEMLAVLKERRHAKTPIRVRVIGRRELLPERLQRAVEASEAASSPAGGTDLTIALAYSGRDELVEACRSAVRELLEAGVPAERLPDQLTGDALAAHLYTRGSSDPDLIIRTSGEVRLSGFLPWQSAYSEFYFCEAFWPAFREIDFLRAVRTYQLRARRFGR